MPFLKLMCMPVSGVVNDLNVLSSRGWPAEADAPLVVDADTVLTLAVAGERLYEASVTDLIAFAREAAATTSKVVLM
jgi:hypothetical protein